MTRVADEAVVYLVPVGGSRFELYCEPTDESGPASGRFHHLQARWHDAVHHARNGQAPAGRFARARDWAVRHGAEMIAEQRTLWSLRHVTAATLVHPADLTGTSADGVRTRLLGHSRRHHGWWLMGDTLLLVVSGVFALVPGPNLLAYYFALRVAGHFLSWRGARQALDRTRWQLRPEPALTELASLADVPRDARAARVEAIATGLHLPRLAAFFERTAVPVRG